jgi:AbrB family looped-hinge helix DNA binding protein
METTSTTKGQIVIPSSVRRKLGIKEGTRILIDVNYEQRTIVLIPITREYVHSLSGKFKGKGLLKALEHEESQEKEI